jgi:hypothetical protein
MSLILQFDDPCETCPFKESHYKSCDIKEECGACISWSDKKSTAKAQAEHMAKEFQQFLLDYRKMEWGKLHLKYLGEIGKYNYSQLEIFKKWLKAEGIEL